VVASSYGLHCARMCGVDQAVLMRAAAVLALREAGQPVSRLQVGTRARVLSRTDRGPVYRPVGCVTGVGCVMISVCCQRQTHTESAAASLADC
jgi:hypothetical protein